MTTVEVRLCPTCTAELRVGWSDALPWCFRCRHHYPRHALRDRDETPCTACEHPVRTHGPRHGLAWACLSGCPCTEPKEKPVITEDNMSHYQTALANQAEADQRADSEDVITDSYRSATVSALLAQADASHAQTAALEKLAAAVEDLRQTIAELKPA